jgi:hypothetical protein
VMDGTIVRCAGNDLEHGMYPLLALLLMHISMVLALVSIG